MPETGNPKWIALTRASIVLGIAAFAAAIFASVFISLQAREQSEANAQLIASARESTARIVDCTEPGGDCYAQGQKRTAAAVVGINEGTLSIIAAALSCQADGIVEKASLARCTVQRSTEDGGNG